MKAVCASADRPDQTPAEIARHRKRKVQPSGLCRTCELDGRRTRRRNARATRVLSTYGLGRDDHDALFRYQGGRCPCGRPITLRSPVDHNHSSGAVRGLMCDPCNRFLGYVKDNPQALRQLADYAENPPYARMLAERERATRLGELDSLVALLRHSHIEGTAWTKGHSQVRERLWQHVSLWQLEPTDTNWKAY